MCHLFHSHTLYSNIWCLEELCYRSSLSNFACEFLNEEAQIRAELRCQRVLAEFLEESFFPCLVSSRFVLSSCSFPSRHPSGSQSRAGLPSLEQSTAECSYPCYF